MAGRPSNYLLMGNGDGTFGDPQKLGEDFDFFKRKAKPIPSPQVRKSLTKGSFFYNKKTNLTIRNSVLSG